MDTNSSADSKIALYDHILQLRALRSYEDRPVSATHVAQLIEAARWTGSSKNRQNWSFVVVDDPQQKAALAGAGDFTDPVRNAPMVIALVQEPEGYEFDTGRLAQNIMLAADALGLATCPITLHRDQQAAEVLGLPGDRRCRYAVAVGYPAASATPGKMGGRKPVEELLHRNRYGG
jgi:nitroreductase